MNNPFLDFTRNWLEGWRVIWRFIVFQFELTLMFLPLTILGKLFGSVVGRALHQIALDRPVLALAAVLFLILAVVIYVPFAFYFTADFSGLLRRRETPAWKKDLED